VDIVSALLRGPIMRAASRVLSSEDPIQPARAVVGARPNAYPSRMRAASSPSCLPARLPDFLLVARGPALYKHIG
jgi:hypothetical protein